MLSPYDHSDCARSGTSPRSAENVCHTLIGSREAIFRPIVTKFDTKVHHHSDIITGICVRRSQLALMGWNSYMA